MVKDPDRREVLVITDNLDGRWVRRLTAARAHGWVLPLGIDPSALARATPAGPWTLVDLTGDALEAQARVRESVPLLIQAVPHQPVSGAETLFDLFEDPAVNRWWFLEIAEKSPLRGRLVNQLYFLALIRATFGRGGFAEIWLAVDDRRLVGVVTDGLGPALPVRRVSRGPASWWGQVLSEPLLRYPIFAGGTWLRSLTRSLSLRAIGLRRTEPLDDAVVFFSFYPAWWNRPYEPEATEQFFEQLPEAIGQRAPVGYAVWLTAGPLALWRHRAAVRRLAARSHLIPLQGVLGVAAAGEVLSLRHLARLIRFRFRLAGRIRATFAGFPVGGLISDEIARSMTGSEFFMDLLISRAFERLASRMRLRTVIYRIEFQPFEKAILAGVKGRAVAVGFQHSTFGQNYLPYFFVPGELATNEDRHPRRMPLPDLFVTTGSYAQDVMIRNGFNPDRMEICGPVRYTRLLDYRKSRPSSTQSRHALHLDPQATIFLVTTSVVRGESRTLLTALGEALELLPALPYIIFKGHPAMPLDGEFRHLVGSRLPTAGCRLLPPHAQIYEYIGAADGVVLTGTTVALEAMLLGVVPIVFESRALFDAKSMSEVEDACFVARDASELSRAMRWIIDGDARVRELRGQWDGAVSRMFDGIDQDPNERFAQILAKHGLVP